MTRQTYQDKVIRAAIIRREDITNAEATRSDALAAANKAFVDTIRPIVESKELTVAQVAGLAGLHRARIHQLLRIHREDSSS